MTDEIRSASERLRESIQARKEIHPHEYRMINLEKKIPEMETAMKGVLWNTNTALGNTRETAQEITSLKERVIYQDGEIRELKASMGSLQADLVAALERVERMAQWAKTKGHEI